MMNPDILPEDAWKKHNEYFNAADGKTFHTALISRNQIYIQLFPECTVWLKVIGSKLHGHDLLMGFDLFFKAQRSPSIWSKVQERVQAVLHHSCSR